MPVLQYKNTDSGTADRTPPSTMPVPRVSMETAGGLQLRDLVLMIRRRGLVLVAAVFLITAASALFAAKLPSHYSAGASVLISGQASSVVDIDSVAVGTEVRRDVDETLNSEMQVLRSRQLAERIVERTGLANIPEFNWTLAEQTTLSKIKGWVKGLVTTETANADVMSPEQRSEQIRTSVVNRYLSSLSIVPRANSLVISLGFEAEDPVVAANVVNTLADQYIALQIEQKSEVTTDAQAWLAGRLEQVRLELEEAERAVEVYRADNDLLQVGSETVVAQQVAQLNSQLVVARAELAEQASRFAETERLANSNDASTSNSALDSRVVQDLRTQEAELARQEAELSSQYGPRHPLLINARAELGEIRVRIDNEVERLVSNQRTELQVARARVAALDGDLRRLQGQASDANQSQVRLRELEREADSARQLFQTFLNRYKEIEDQEGLQTADARVISYAAVPNNPSSPNRQLIVAIAFLMSTVVGLLLVFAVEHFDSGFRSSDQIDAEMGVPSLGLIPALERADLKRTSSESFVLANPTSAFAESFRTLRTNLHLADRQTPPKIVLFTSALPAEGKTTSAISLARLAAAMGENVLLIDADNRRPRAHDALGLPKEPGIVEYLEDQASLWDIIQSDRESPLHFVSAGRPITNSIELWRSDQLKYFLSQLRSRYDLIIIDSSPVLAVADARILSSVADATVFVTKWRDTKREAAIHGVQQTLEAGANLAGVLLTQVNVREHARYGFSDSGYYQSYYTGYADS